MLSSINIATLAFSVEYFDLHIDCEYFFTLLRRNTLIYRKNELIFSRFALIYRWILLIRVFTGECCDFVTGTKISRGTQKSGKFYSGRPKKKGSIPQTKRLRVGFFLTNSFLVPFIEPHFLGLLNEPFFWATLYFLFESAYILVHKAERVRPFAFFFFKFTHFLLRNVLFGLLRLFSIRKYGF